MTIQCMFNEEVELHMVQHSSRKYDVRVMDARAKQTPIMTGRYLSEFGESQFPAVAFCACDGNQYYTWIGRTFTSKVAALGFLMRQAIRFGMVAWMPTPQYPITPSG